MDQASRTRIATKSSIRSSRRNRSAPVSGWGLSIVDNIVRDLEGSIDAENRAAGSGARFVIDLPAGETKAEAAE
jgi:K+-sensing histidine kinase KdpD